MQHGPWVLRTFVLLHDLPFVSKSVMMESRLLWASNNNKNIMHCHADRFVALYVFSDLWLALLFFGGSTGNGQLCSLLELPSSSSSLHHHHNNAAIVVVRCGFD